MKTYHLIIKDQICPICKLEIEGEVQEVLDHFNNNHVVIVNKDYSLNLNPTEEEVKNLIKEATEL